METNLQYKKKYLKYKHKYYNLIVNNIQNGGSDFDEKKDKEESFKESIVRFVNYNKDRILTISTSAIMIIISSVIIGLLHTGVIISSMHSQLFLTIVLIVLSVYKGYDVYSDIQERSEEADRKEKMLKEKAEKNKKKESERDSTVEATGEETSKLQSDIPNTESQAKQENRKGEEGLQETREEGKKDLQETREEPVGIPKMVVEEIAENNTNIMKGLAQKAIQNIMKQDAQGTTTEMQGTSNAVNTQAVEKKPPPPVNR